MLAVITGATKGIGKAIALKFAEEGFDLAINARSESGLKAFESELKNRFPKIKILAMVTDMSVREDVKRFSDAVKATWNQLDVLINNAGVFLPSTITDGPEEDFVRMMDTNLYSCYYATRDLLPMMPKGHIFNIASIASIMPYSTYSVSKFAMLGFSKVLREEVKNKGIRVTAVMPGATYTDSWAGTTLPEERFMPAEDIAETIFSAWKLSPRTVIEEIILRPQLGDI